MQNIISYINRHKLSVTTATGIAACVAAGLVTGQIDFSSFLAGVGLAAMTADLMSD